MYERLDKLRAEVERCKKKVEDDKVRLRAAEQKLQEAENSQILADVGALNLSPEQLAEFLKLATSGKLGSAGTANAYETTDEVTATEPSKADTEDDYDLEDLEDEEKITQMALGDERIKKYTEGGVKKTIFVKRAKLLNIVV